MRSHMELLGIMAGLAAATCQSASYLFSRLFALRVEGAVLRLLVLSHALMGAVALAVLPLAWTPDAPPLRQFILPLLGTSGFYLLGQVGFFVLVQRVDASRAAPLLAFKIVVLALISSLALKRVLGAQQWAAVLLCLAGAFLTTSSGASRLKKRNLLWLVWTCTFYSLSDLSIGAMVSHSFGMLSHFRASLLGVTLAYVVCGAVALLLLPAVGFRRALTGWRYAAPFSAFWLLAMFLLFLCFSMIGPVYGNVVQSLRGVLSVAIGAAVARLGYHELEQPVTRGTLWRRLAAAGILCLAVWLYQSGNRHG